jgi:molybdopterin synthase sulfur carrier subunit
VRVSFYATLRDIVGARTVDLAVAEPISVRDLVAAMLASHPALAPVLIDASGDLSRGVHVFVNGRGAGFLPDGLDTRVSAADAVDVFPAVAGG